MAVRSIASLSLTFGLVSIPVKLYSATENSAALRFKWMSAGGARLRQQYVTERSTVGEKPATSTAMRLPEALAPERPPALASARSTPNYPTAQSPLASAASEEDEEEEGAIIERAEMLKGYEYERGKFVLFTPEELKALQAESRKTIDIVSFIPEKTVDPIYYDKAYLLAPAARGSKPYNLLLRAMRETERCALAKWAFRSKEYVVQIRAADGGLVLQQLLYADEVRSFAALRIEADEIGAAELSLAKQLIAQIAAPCYDPSEFIDEEKKRVLDAVQRKIAGQPWQPARAKPSDRKVIDLLGALQASLRVRSGLKTSPSRGSALGERKPAKRAPNKPPPVFSQKGRSGAHKIR